MALTFATWKEDFPEFVSIAESIYLRFKGRAEDEMDADTWGEVYDDALGNLLAHKLAIRAQGAAGSGNVGAVSSMSVGGMSIGYQAVTTTSPADALLATTLYGREFLRLRDALILLPVLG